ncbi:MAG: helix-hairpin-helix domain-containing protein [Candidatus Thermoplasmatota archaeon]
MVRERKTRGKDIEKIHELIDSASVQKRKTTSLTKEEQLQLIRKHLANESLKNQKQVTPFEKPHTTSENLTPQVVVRNKQETKKKEEKVIQIDLGPRKIIKEEEPAAIKFIPIQEDVFAQEPLFEIEKVEVPMQEFTEIRAGTSLKESEDHLAPFPGTPVRKEIQEHLPEFQPVPEGALFPETSRRMKWKKPKAFYQRSQDMNDEETSSPISFQEEERQSPSFEPGEFQPLAEERKEPMRFEMQNKELDSYKQKKIKEKQHEKLKEREAKHLAKEQKKRLKIETLKSHQKKQEEQQRKNWELRQAFAQAEEQEREEQRLLKEQEKKSRLEIIERQQKEKEQRKQKKREEKQVKLELKEKKRETKRLAKEHDTKLKLEWIEFQSQQRQKKKQEELEKRKAAVEAKQQEQEERHLLKEREEKLRVEQIQLMKKEKEAKRLVKGQKPKVQLETEEAQPQNALQQRQPTTHEEEQTLEEQRPLTEIEEKSRFGLSEQQKTEKEEQRSIFAKKEKKTFVLPLFEKKKPAEEQTDGVPWESFQEDPEREPDHQDSLQTEEPTSPETQKQLLKEKKRQQKQLEREQKKQAQQERLEVKKKEKEEKKQRKIEEKQRSHLFGFSKENKEMWQGKNEEETFSKREAAAKERDEKRRLKEEQRRKERASAIEEVEQKKKEKNEKKLKDFDQKKERRQISMLSFGKGNDTEVIDEQKQAEQQKQTMDLVRIAAEEKDLRKTRALERKMKKEQRKNEKVEQKYKMKEEDNARKKMNLHMQEEIMKEKLTNNQLERNDPFVAFDSIDQETANVLDHYGYSSVEKLRQATVKDLLKTGLKKKTAQRIIAECGEFVEWQVFDSIDHF